MEKIKMQNIKVILGIFLGILCLTSCGNFEEISIGEPEEFNIRGFEDNFLKVQTKIPVANPTFYRIKILEIDLRVYLNDKYIGKLLVDDKIVIKPKSKDKLDLPIKIRLSNILNTAFIMMNLKSGQESVIRFEGTVKAKSLFMLKTIDINETRKIRI